jgi:hypothetical protein
MFCARRKIIQNHKAYISKDGSMEWFATEADSSAYSNAEEVREPYIKLRLQQLYEMKREALSYLEKYEITKF